MQQFEVWSLKQSTVRSAREEEAELLGEALVSYPHLWSQNLGSDQKNGIKAVKNNFLCRVVSLLEICWEVHLSERLRVVAPPHGEEPTKGSSLDIR